MAVAALWRENVADHHAVQYRQMLAMFAGVKLRALGSSATTGLNNGGVSEADALKVTQRGAGANMSVDVAVGGCTVGGTAGAGSAHRGDYFAYNDATANVVISASDPANPRIDVVGVRIRDTAYAEADNTPVITVVTGVPNAVPVVPALPDNFLTLAHVAVAAAAASITNANITDKRVVWAAMPYNVMATRKRTAGVLLNNFANWTDLNPGWDGAAAQDIVLPARVGDVAQAQIGCLWGSEATYGLLDVKITASGNYIGSASDPNNNNGLPGIYGNNTVAGHGYLWPNAGSGFRALVAADIAAGVATFRVRERTIGAKTLFATAVDNLVFIMRNIGPIAGGV